MLTKRKIEKLMQSAEAIYDERHPDPHAGR